MITNKTDRVHQGMIPTVDVIGFLEREGKMTVCRAIIAPRENGDIGLVTMIWPRASQVREYQNDIKRLADKLGITEIVYAPRMD